MAPTEESDFPRTLWEPDQHDAGGCFHDGRCIHIEWCRSHDGEECDCPW